PVRGFPCHGDHDRGTCRQLDCGKCTPPSRALKYLVIESACRDGARGVPPCGSAPGPTAQVGLSPEGACWSPSTRGLLGINAGMHPGRLWGMRHRLPHTRGMGGRMLLLLLPLCAFGHCGTFKLIDGGIPAGALMDPIAAGVHHPRHLAVARNILAGVP